MPPAANSQLEPATRGPAATAASPPARRRIDRGHRSLATARHARLLTPVLLTLVLLLGGAGCSWIGISPQDLDRSLDEAHTALAAGRTERAIDLLHDVARHRPRSVETRQVLVEACLTLDTIQSRRLAAAALRELVELRPDDPGHRHALGTLLFRQGFDHASENELHRLVLSTPGHVGGHLALGELHRARWQSTCDDAELVSMQESLGTARRLAPDDGNIRQRASAGLMLTGRLEEALADLTPATQRWPDDTELQALRAVCLLGLGRAERAAAAFEQLLDRLSPEQRFPYLDVSLLASPYEIQRLRSLPPDEHLDFLRFFWKEQDPTPTTALNERRLEHFRRITMANLYYDHPLHERRGATTTKGQLLIRYGEPYWDEWYMFPALVHAYTIGGQPALVHFVNIAGEFYLPFTSGLSLVDAATYLAPQTYDHVYPGEWLDHAVRVVGFRGADHLTRAEVHLALPSDATLDERALDLELQVVAFDSAWEELARVEELLPYCSVSRAGRDGRARIHQVDLELPPGEYRIATQLRATGGELFGTATREAKLRDFSPARLGISDLEIAFAIESTGQQRFQKGRLYVLPNATGEFEMTESLAVYFEIYHLPLRDGHGRYALSYRIRPAARHGDSFWGRLLDAMRLRTFVEARLIEESATADTSRHLSIDIGELPPDRYDLTITILDLVAEKRVTRTVQFERTERPAERDPPSRSSRSF